MDERFIIIAVRTAILVFIAIIGISLVHAQGNKNISPTDKKFIEEAYKDGLAAIAIGKLAMTRAGNHAVKDFANRSVKDRTAANKKLIRLASKQGVSISRNMGNEDSEESEKLSRMGGQDFDRAYMEHEVKYHEKGLKEYSGEVSNGSNSDLKTFAYQMLPELERHLNMARTVEQKIGGSHA